MCKTQSGPNGGPSKNKNCVFPFKEGGKLVNYCVKGSGKFKHKNFCATKVNKKKEYDGGHWGWCNNNCPNSTTALQDINNGK